MRRCRGVKFHGGESKREVVGVMSVMRVAMVAWLVKGEGEGEDEGEGGKGGEGEGCE